MQDAVAELLKTFPGVESLVPFCLQLLVPHFHSRAGAKTSNQGSVEYVESRFSYEPSCDLMGPKVGKQSRAVPQLSSPQLGGVDREEISRDPVLCPINFHHDLPRI